MSERGAPYSRIPLGDVCTQITDGTHKTPNYAANGIPFISTANLRPFRAFDFSSYRRFITEREHRLLVKRCNPQFGDVLVAKIGTLGLAKAVDVHFDFSIFVGLALLKLRTDSVLPEYLEQLLNTPGMVREMENASPGSTRATLTIKAIKCLRVPLPPIPVQRRVAAILNALDDAIRRTEQIIAKLQQMKQGLLHDLLTRGIDEKGDLRPSPTEAPHIYEDSPLGRIPKGWEIRSVGQTATLQRGIDLPVQSRRDGLIPVYGSNGIDGWHDRSPFGGPGVITGRSGSIGIIHMSDGPYWPLNTTLFVKDFHGNEPRWVALLLQSLRLERFTAATSVPSLNRNFVHPQLVAVPPRRQQIAIVAGLEMHVERERHEVLALEKLHILKDGLLHDLLTGRVCVPLAAEASA